MINVNFVLLYLVPVVFVYFVFTSSIYLAAKKEVESFDKNLKNPPFYRLFIYLLYFLLLNLIIFIPIVNLFLFIYLLVQKQYIKDFWNLYKETWFYKYSSKLFSKELRNMFK
jgi:hypothetical protein